MNCQTSKPTLFALFVFLALGSGLWAQDSIDGPEVPLMPSTGWSEEAITLGYVAAPSAAALMFVSTLITDWNAGYAGIPATSLYILAPPLIWMGGRSVEIPLSQGSARARLGWTLYALAMVPTSLAFYEFTTDWGANLPLTISSTLLGTASILAMTSYATLRKNLATDPDPAEASLNLGLSPLPGGGLISLSYRF